mgnify:CR=1 FL=1
MISLAKAFLDNPELQVAVIAPLTTAIVQGLKKLGIIKATPAKWRTRIAAALMAGGVGYVGLWLAAQTIGTAPDWTQPIPAIILAWLAATGLRGLTKPTT